MVDIESEDFNPADPTEMIKYRISELARNPVNSYVWYGWIDNKLEGPEGSEGGRGFLRVGKELSYTHKYRLETPPQDSKWWQRIIKPKKEILIPVIWWVTNYWIPGVLHRFNPLSKRYATNLKIPGNGIPTIFEVIYNYDELGKKIILLDNSARVVTPNDFDFFTRILESQLNSLPPLVPKDTYGLADLGYLK